MCYKNGTLRSPKTLLTKVAQTGVLLESKKMKDYQLAGFIEKYLKVHNTTIEPKATQMIADHIGPDLHRLTSELDKVGKRQESDARNRGTRNRSEQGFQCLRTEKCDNQQGCFQGKSDSTIF